MQRDAQEHLLGRFQRHVLTGVNHIPLEQQVQTGIGEQLVPLGAEEGRSLADLGPGIVLQNVAAVETLVGQVAQLVIKGMNAPAGKLALQPQRKREVQQPRRHELPPGGLGAGQLHRRLGQSGQQLGGVHLRLCKAREPCRQRGEGINQLVEVLLDAHQALLQTGRVHLRRNGLAGSPQLGVAGTVKNVAFGGLKVALLHQRPLHLVLNLLHRDQLAAQPPGHRVQQAGQLLHAGGLPHAGKGFFHGGKNLAPVEGLGLAAALLNLHGVSSRECLFCNVSYYTPHLEMLQCAKPISGV